MAAAMIQVIPKFLQTFQEKVTLFLQTPMKNTLYVKTAVLFTTMTSCSFYTFSGVTSYQ